MGEHELADKMTGRILGKPPLLIKRFRAEQRRGRFGPGIEMVLAEYVVGLEPNDRYGLAFFLTVLVSHSLNQCIQ